MFRTLKHQARGFLFGILTTVLIIGVCHIEIRFSRGPEAYELSQTEAIATHLSQVMPNTKGK